MHEEYTIRAARAGVHVLCEKPMAVTVRECQQMITTCRNARVKLLIAYRLHFDALNISAMEIAHRGQLGELKLFDSAFAPTHLTTRREGATPRQKYKARVVTERRRCVGSGTACNRS
jgi:glucose-fructose oxidoreductase